MFRFLSRRDFCICTNICTSRRPNLANSEQVRSKKIYEYLITTNISTQSSLTPVRRLKHAVSTQHTLTCITEQIYLGTDLHCSYSKPLNRHPSNKDATNKLDKTVRPIYGHAARCWSSIISQWHYPHRLAVDREALIRMIV